MKVILAALNAKYVHSNLAIYDLEAYAKKHLKEDIESNEIELLIREYTINHNLDLILRSIYQEKAEVVAFSCYIWNIYEILTIAKELHKVSPNTKIWLGGPEVSYNSVQLLEENEFLEGIMLGEGEATLCELLTYWKMKNKDYTKVLGISYRDENQKIHLNKVRPLLSLDEVPFIYQDLSQFKNKILYYETSRGCPFSCSYCLSSIDKTVRFRSLSLVEKELQYFLDQKVAQVKFIDRTFNCKREHSLFIWNYITEHDNGITNFHFEVAADLIGPEEIEVFKKMRPGLIQLEIGLQSTHLPTIHEIRRAMNIEKVKKTLLTIREFQNIHQHLDLIAGLPYEDFETFKQSFNDAYEMKPNQLQLGFLKVLKGSYMGEQVKDYELKYQDTQPYEVLCTKWISYDEILLLKNVEEMVEVYYNSDQFEHVLPYVVSFFSSPYVFYETLGAYYEKYDLFGIGFKREARYIVFRDFCKVQFENNDDFSFEVLDSLLTFDYYLRENAKSRPQWSKEEPIEKRTYQDFFKNAGNEEISLEQVGYDSKVAARTMHIEPIVSDALDYLMDFHPQLCPKDINKKNIIFCLYDYDNRNPLSKDATIHFLTTL